MKNSPNHKAAHLATRRRRKGLTQHQLAERVGISRPLLSGIENGRLLPRLLHVKRIAEVLECSTRTVLKDLGFV